MVLQQGLTKAERPTLGLKVGALSHVVLVNLETEINHLGNQ